jgi:transcriptional regulator with XRE-family HTH domain
MSRYILIFSIFGDDYNMKIYDYNGKKNICGDRIHEARCRLRLTQSDLAAKLQIAGIMIERDSISRIEIGTRFVADYELREFARILKVSVNWLLGLE